MRLRADPRRRTGTGAPTAVQISNVSVASLFQQLQALAGGAFSGVSFGADLTGQNLPTSGAGSTSSAAASPLSLAPFSQPRASWRAGPPRRADDSNAPDIGGKHHLDAQSGRRRDPQSRPGRAGADRRLLDHLAAAASHRERLQQHDRRQRRAHSERTGLGSAVAAAKRACCLVRWSSPPPSPSPRRVERDRRIDVLDHANHYRQCGYRHNSRRLERWGRGNHLKALRRADRDS